MNNTTFHNIQLTHTARSILGVPLKKFSLIYVIHALRIQQKEVLLYFLEPLEWSRMCGSKVIRSWGCIGKYGGDRSSVPDEDYGFSTFSDWCTAGWLQSVEPSTNLSRAKECSCMVRSSG